MTSAPENTFDIPESAAAEEIGVPASILKNLRRDEVAIPEVHWSDATRRILWSRTGLAFAAEKIGAPAPPTPPPTPPVNVYEVARARTPRVLHVIAEGETYDPRQPRCLWLPQPVGRLFRPGMKILARTRPGSPVLDYEGNPAGNGKSARRFPRRAGVW